MPTIHLNITQRCNQKCFFCVRSHAPVKQPELKALLHYAKSQRDRGADKCIITGGEPFLSPILFSLIDRIKKLGFTRVTIQTNATLLSSGQLCDKLQSATDGISCDLSISLHSIDEFEYSRITGAHGHLSRILKSFFNLTERSIPFCTNTVIFKDNISNLESIAQYARNAGAYLIQFSLMRYTNGDLANGAVSLEDVRIEAKKLSSVIPMDCLRFEGIPFCFLRGMEKCVAESYWPRELRLLTSTGKQVANYQKDLMPEYRRKLPTCSRCIFISFFNGGGIFPHSFRG